MHEKALWMLFSTCAIVRILGSCPLPLCDPILPTMNTLAPSTFDVEFNTTVGVFVVRMVREWAPRGVDRVYNLVNNGFYDDTRIYRSSCCEG